MQYESAKVKVFVHATDADVDGRAMTLAPRTFLSRLPKKLRLVCVLYLFCTFLDKNEKNNLFYTFLDKNEKNYQLAY